eukprot:GHRR01010202.1.p1 GENE.GHRR01010202.1~~GHRR01010202.1.p1  ORF type:complete len:707 (+),score=240.27 GHRR01010202.1:2191-4311(+)
MPRVDIWDVPDPAPAEPLFCGYKRGIHAEYEFDSPLGEGGFGTVRVVRHRSSGVEFACKSICKRLDVPNLPPIKQQQHLENIQREVLILRKLRGTLNVIHLEDVYEDDTHVHIIMEYCRGGELLHRMGHRHYSERTVASYMRAVLRTLAQCHTHRILHRDIKPGNFMLLTEAEDSPLKAIDFGLAVFFNPSNLPLTDLGLEGTPWYMAPEVLSSAVEPASDVWAAGVMAYQLLSGRFPFDDWQNPQAPALSLVWRSILGEEPSFSWAGWQNITNQAQDFCRTLLNKDPKQRPSAREALHHPWLLKGNRKERKQGTLLTQVVQRLQRHKQQNIFKKTVLDMMANELLARHMATMRKAEEEEEAASLRHQQQLQQQEAPQQQQQRQQEPHGMEYPLGTQAEAGASPLNTAVNGVSQTYQGLMRQHSGSQHSTGAGQQPPALPNASGLTKNPSSVSVAVPQYQEGSVHRQQQLLRLIPPKRSHSSLDLNPAEVQRRMRRSKDLDRSVHGANSEASADQADAGADARGGDGSHQGASASLAATLPANRRLLAAAAAARLEGTWHGISSLRRSASGDSTGSDSKGRGFSLFGQQLQGTGSVHGGLEGSAHRAQGYGSVKGATTALEALRRARERRSYGGGLALLGVQDSQQQQQHEGSGGGSDCSIHSGAADSGYHGPVRDAPAAALWDLQSMAHRLAMEGSAHGNAYARR